jgi:hypothetical protein
MLFRQSPIQTALNAECLPSEMQTRLRPHISFLRTLSALFLVRSIFIPGPSVHAPLFRVPEALTSKQLQPILIQCLARLPDILRKTEIHFLIPRSILMDHKSAGEFQFDKFDRRLCASISHVSLHIVSLCWGHAHEGQSQILNRKFRIWIVAVGYRTKLRCSEQVRL